MHGNLALSHPKTDELSHMNWGIPTRLLLWCVDHWAGDFWKFPGETKDRKPKPDTDFCFNSFPGKKRMGESSHWKNL